MHFLLSLVFAVLLAGCLVSGPGTTQSPTPTPYKTIETPTPSAIIPPTPSLVVKQLEVVQKPVLNFSVNASDFIKAGCVEEEGFLNCSKAGLEKRFNCSFISFAPNHLGGLKQNKLVQCVKTLTSVDQQTEGIIMGGCVLPDSITYVFSNSSGFVHVKTKDQLQKFAAPIETVEEALSYVAASTGAYPIFNLSVPQNYEPLAQRVETSYAEKTLEGFKVYLFNMEVCGCGRHPTYSIDYLVSRDGNLTRLKREDVYQLTYEMCVD